MLRNHFCIDVEDNNSFFPKTRMAISIFHKEIGVESIGMPVQ
jgi:hypothetical protein